MKKARFLVMALLMVLVMTGCGNSASGTNSSEGSAKTSEEAKSAKITLYLTRHGKTMLNTMDLSQGWVDSPLTPAGIEVAEKLGEGLKKSDVTFDKVYSSDAGRARETAKLILENSDQNKLKINEDKRFREANFGSYEAKPNAEMAKAAMEELKMTQEEFMSQEDGVAKLSDALHAIDSRKDSSEMGWPAESGQEVKDRLVAATEDVIKTAKKEGNSDILIVFHGNSIMELLHSLDPDGEMTPVENASISKVVYENGKYTVESVNDTSYIAEK